MSKQSYFSLISYYLILCVLLHSVNAESDYDTAINESNHTDGICVEGQTCEMNNASSPAIEVLGSQDVNSVSTKKEIFWEIPNPLCSSNDIPCTELPVEWYIYF